MNLLTRQGMAKHSAKVMLAMLKINGKGKEDMASSLENLGDTPDPNEVDAITGNSMWTHALCDFCDEYVDVAVTGSDEPETDHNPTICHVCAVKAVELMNNENSSK